MALRNQLTLPAVPPAAPATHPTRDLVLIVLFLLALTAFATVDPLEGRAVHLENRALTPWPALSLTGQLSARFDAAFADHFRGRNALIALQHAIVVLGFDSSPGGNVIVGRDDWLYFAGEDGHTLDRFVRGTMPVGDDAIRSLVAEVERRRAWLAARGIPYVVTIAPDKATIYPEHLPAWVQPMRAPTPLDRALRALAQDPRLHVADLREPLRAAKTRELVYYRTDSHWNYLGAIVGYQALMREIQRAVGTARLPSIAAPDMPAYVPGVDTYRGDLARILGVPRRYDEADVAPFAKVLGDDSRRCARRIDDGKDEGFEFYACSRAPDLRAVMYRDSMAIPLIPLMSENFRRIVYVSSQKLDRALIEREHPDVVIEELVERNLEHPAAFAMQP
jgi:alginate O-acetyltransferase complex protein AlgJ